MRRRDHLRARRVGSRADRAVLRDRLDTLGAPHSWEDTTLVVAGDRRGVGGADHGPGGRGAVDRAGRRGDEDEQVAYDLTDWDDDSCVALLDALATEKIPYGLDGDELFVGAADEARVDEIVAALTTPGATLTAGGPASFEAMSELFVAADELSHDPDDKGATRARRRCPRRGRRHRAVRDGAGWWDGVVAPRWRAGRPGRDADPTPSRSSTSPPPSATSCARTSEPMARWVPPQ